MRSTAADTLRNHACAPNETTRMPRIRTPGSTSFANDTRPGINATGCTRFYVLSGIRSEPRPSRQAVPTWGASRKATIR